MATDDPATDLDTRYSDPDASPVPWATTQGVLAAAELSWLITVSEGATAYFCTGPDERKCRNLVAIPHVVLTTGNNAWQGGLDVVLEGEAVRVTDPAVLRRLAD